MDKDKELKEKFPEPNTIPGEWNIAALLPKRNAVDSQETNLREAFPEPQGWENGWDTTELLSSNERSSIQ